MRFTYVTALFAAAALVSAQNQKIQFQVGGTAATPGGFLQFSPNTITAANGSVVTFVFSGIPGNHSVTQSTFDAPCTSFKGGFDSGWVAILANTTTLPTWDLTITNDQIPIWFFCKAPLPAPHCNAGMVGVINVKPGANSIGAFAQKAQTAALDMHEGGLVGLGASASALPVIDGGATLFVTDSATAGPQTGSAAPVASSDPASKPSGTGAAGGAAMVLGWNPALLLGSVVFGVGAGAAIVL